MTLGGFANLTSAAGLTLEDSIFQGIGTVTFNTTGSTFAQITQLNDSNLTQLTISGAGVDIHTLKDAGTTLTVTDSSSNTNGFDFGDVAINAPNLTTLSFNNTGAGTLTVGPAAGFTEANLTSLTLKGAVAVSELTDSANDVTVTGGTDNAGVGMSLTGNGTVVVTRGNGNDGVITGAAQATISLGSGSDVVAIGNSSTASITFASHATSTQDTVYLGPTAGSTSHIATVTGLNSAASGSEVIIFVADASATGAVTQVSTATVGAYA